MPKYTKIIFAGLTWAELLIDRKKLAEYWISVSEKRKLRKEGIFARRLEVQKEIYDLAEVERMKGKARLLAELKQKNIIAKVEEKQKKVYEKKAVKDFEREMRRFRNDAPIIIFDIPNPKINSEIIDNEKYPKTIYGYSGKLFG